MKDHRRGIEEYDKEQKIILRLLRFKGKLTASDFDRLFGDYKTKMCDDGTLIQYRRKIKLRFCGSKGHTYILGSPFQGQWSQWLHLIRLMFRIGLVKIELIGRDIVYSLTEQGRIKAA